MPPSCLNTAPLDDATDPDFPAVGGSLPVTLEKILQATGMKEAPMLVLLAAYSNVNALTDLFYNFQDDRDGLFTELSQYTKELAANVSDICKLMILFDFYW